MGCGLLGTSRVMVHTVYTTCSILVLWISARVKTEILLSCLLQGRAFTVVCGLLFLKRYHPACRMCLMLADPFQGVSILPPSPECNKDPGRSNRMLPDVPVATGCTPMLPDATRCSLYRKSNRPCQMVHPAASGCIRTYLSASRSPHHGFYREGVW